MSVQCSLCTVTGISVMLAGTARKHLLYIVKGKVNRQSHRGVVQGLLSHSSGSRSQSSHKGANMLPQRSCDSQLSCGMGKWVLAAQTAKSCAGTHDAMLADHMQLLEWPKALSFHSCL